MSEILAPAADAESDAREDGYSTVSAAVAELERRDAERREARKAEREAAKGAADADDDDDDTDADEEPRAERVKRGEDEDKPAKKAKAKADEDDSDEDDDDAEREEDDEGDDEADDEEADAEDDADERPKATAKQAEQPPQKVRIRLDGRDIDATPDEVSEYVQRTHTQRQQLAQQYQQLQVQQQALQQHGAVLAQLAQQLVGAEPDITLAQTAPGEYIAQQALWRQRAQLVQQLHQQQQAAQQQLAAQQQQAFADQVVRNREALLRAMPELADDAKRQAFQGRVAKVAQKYGFTPAELAGAYDARSYLMFRDLIRLADMEAGAQGLKTKLKSAPPVKPPEQRAALGQRNTNEARGRDAKKQFLKSGRSMRDVRAFLRATEQ